MTTPAAIVLLSRDDLEALVEQAVSRALGSRPASAGLLTEAAAAAQLGVPKSTLAEWRRGGRIEALPLGGSRRQIRYDPATLERFAAQGAAARRRPSAP